MSDSQVYFLLGLWLYLNLFGTGVLLVKEHLDIKKKMIFVFILWLIPFLGYLYSINSVTDNKVNKVKDTSLFSFNIKDIKLMSYSLVIIFYSVVFFLLQ